MTLCLTWIRTVGDTRELVMATDSRLSSGCTWDCGPKIMPMPRSDFAMSFAGDTQYAYPLILQIASAISHHSKSHSRAMDLHDLKGHTLRVFNELRRLITDLPPGFTLSRLMSATITLAGYSWKKKNFVIWVLHPNNKSGEFEFRTVRKIAITGDYVSEAKVRLIKKLKPSGRNPQLKYDMEPFQVLCDMIRSGEYPRIGGAPQLFKLYESMTSRPYAVFWPNRASNRLTLLGRPLLGYEALELLAIDPDSLRTIDSQKPDGEPGGHSAKRRARMKEIRLGKRLKKAESNALR